MDGQKMLDKNVVLPSEIELDEIENNKGHDMYAEDNFLDFDLDEAIRERQHINRIIRDLKATGSWVER